MNPLFDLIKELFEIEVFRRISNKAVENIDEKKDEALGTDTNVLRANKDKPKTE